MAVAKVNCFIPAAKQRVFELITDHGNYDQFDSVLMSRLIKEGNINPNGLGAIRELKVSSLRISSVRFIEEISSYDPPSRFGYQVLTCYLCLGKKGKEISFPLIHQKGEITLEEHNGGTNVFWLSQFTVDLPFGQQIAKLMQPLVEQAFGRILQDCKMALS